MLELSERQARGEFSCEFLGEFIGEGVLISAGGITGIGGIIGSIGGAGATNGTAGAPFTGTVTPRSICEGWTVTVCAVLCSSSNKFGIYSSNNSGSLRVVLLKGSASNFAGSICCMSFGGSVSLIGLSLIR